MSNSSTWHSIIFFINVLDLRTEENLGTRNASESPIRARIRMMSIIMVTRLRKLLRFTTAPLVNSSWTSRTYNATRRHLMLPAPTSPTSSFRLSTFDVDFGSTVYRKFIPENFVHDPADTAGALYSIDPRRIFSSFLWWNIGAFDADAFVGVVVAFVGVSLVISLNSQPLEKLSTPSRSYPTSFPSNVSVFILCRIKFEAHWS